MTQEVNRVDSELIPLKLFSNGLTEGWIVAPISEAHSAQESGSEAHLMAFSFNERQSSAPLENQALPGRSSATTLYVTGTLLELFCYSVTLDRLAMAMGDQPAGLQ